MITISLIRLNNLTLIRLPCVMWTSVMLHATTRQRKLSDETSSEWARLSVLRGNFGINNLLVGEYVCILGTLNTLSVDVE